jgi:hypothetical protein
MKVGDLVYCPCRAPAVTGIVVEIEEPQLEPPGAGEGVKPYRGNVQVMTDQGLEWWEEDELELV